MNKLLELLKQRNSIDASFIQVLFWVQHLFTYFLKSFDSVLKFLQADLMSFNKANGKISELKDKCQKAIAESIKEQMGRVVV